MGAGKYAVYNPFLSKAAVQLLSSITVLMSISFLDYGNFYVKTC